MSWAEAWFLTMELAGDPSSRVGARMADWSHPMSREGMAVMDLFDVTVRVNSGKKSPQPYPRPWDPKVMGAIKTLTQPQILAALTARGHGSNPAPMRDAKGRLRDAHGRFTRG